MQFSSNKLVSEIKVRNIKKEIITYLHIKRIEVVVTISAPKTN